MIDIVIGSVRPPGPPVNGTPSGNGKAVEAEILNIRPPRQNSTPEVLEERRKTFRQDPHNGQVLTILVPSSFHLPRDLDEESYKVMLRFLKK